MRYVAILAIVAVVPGPSAAQEPKPLKTLRIQQAAPGATELFVVDDDGTVRIDWEKVETLARLKTDRIALPTAQVMLAIRDRTWKPMK
ncbi:hypothetical protein RPD_0006 [Rhodopseudomonas palustris BisB5]|uniref:Uncharacterized protein n=1 Tax=Rhodopseudomonas palustris (strain BisB5) TaxID=316057 RepID=Q13F93_RHOPS|nr:hypothetical protein RPD_0006 [Rhodopseudomonas palustris BisB5]